MISYMISYFKYQLFACCSLQARFVNDAVDAARAGSVFYSPLQLRTPQLQRTTHQRRRNIQPAQKLILWSKQAHVNLGSDTLPCRPFSLGRGPGSTSRYRLIICDITYDIPDLGMMSQFAIYDIIYDIIKLCMISHILIYNIEL